MLWSPELLKEGSFPMHEIAEITSTELAERAAGTRPLLVAFTRAACPWCARQEPELVRISAQYADHIDTVAVRVDTAPGLAAEYALRGVPTLVLLRDGRRLGSKHGFQRAQQIRPFLRHHLAELQT